MASPRPEPGPFPEPRQKRSKARARSDGLIPRPWSATRSTTRPPTVPADTRTTPPGGEACTALATRLSRTCPRASGAIAATRAGSARGMELDAALGRQRGPAVGALADQGPDVAGLVPGGVPVRAGQREQGVDEPGEALGLGLGAPGPGASGGPDPVLEVLEPQPEGGEGGAKLVRGVGDELALGPDQRVEPLDGLVHHRGQRAHLGRAPVRRRPRGAVPLAHGARRRPQPAQRTGQGRGEAPETRAARARTTTPTAASSSQSRRTRAPPPRSGRSPAPRR